MHNGKARLVLAFTAVMVVVWAGVAAGSNGQPVVIGQNNTGTAGTTLTTTQTGTPPGFLVILNGSSTGAAIKGQSNGTGNGVSGVATAANAFGTRSFNTAPSHGTGAAGAFSGQQNDGVRGTTDDASAFGVFGHNTSGNGVYGLSDGDGNGVFGRTGSPGASGVYGENTGGGYGVAGRSNVPGGIGVFGDASSGTGGYFAGGDYGVQGLDGAAAGVFGSSTGGYGVQGSSTNNYGVSGESSSSYGIVGATTGGIAGVSGSSSGGSNGGRFASTCPGAACVGVTGYTNDLDGTSGSIGVYGSSGSTNGYAIYSAGNAKVAGDLTVTGAKSGYVSDIAVNASRRALHQGDAVAIAGVRAPTVGKIPTIVIRPARAGDQVIGVVDRRVVADTLTKVLPAPANRPEPASSSTGRSGGPDQRIKMRMVHAAGTTVAPGELLYVVTLGAFGYASVDASSGVIRPGDSLAVGRALGILTKARVIRVQGATFAVPGTSVGYALGTLNDGKGRIGIFVNPH
jgi:hypothetical protein